MSLSRRFARSFAAALLLSASFAAAQEYKIQFTRPDKVGDEFVADVSAKSSTKMDATVNGALQPIKDESFKAEMHGTVKVLAVNDKSGEATKVSVTIDKLTKDGNDVYPAGTVIIAEKTGPKASFQIDGKPAEAENVEVLDSVISVSDATRDNNDDALTGTDQAQKVGGTWPVNSDKLAKDMSSSGLPLTPDELKGESKLVEVKTDNGVEVMVVHTDVNADGIKKDMPDGSAISNGKMTAEVTYTMPTDTTLPLISGTEKTHIAMDINLAGGAGTAKVVNDREVTKARSAKK
jgi:hypothetical protein